MEEEFCWRHHLVGGSWAKPTFNTENVRLHSERFSQNWTVIEEKHRETKHSAPKVKIMRMILYLDSHICFCPLLYIFTCVFFSFFAACFNHLNEIPINPNAVLNKNTCTNILKNDWKNNLKIRMLSAASYRVQDHWHVSALYISPGLYK